MDLNVVAGARYNLSEIRVSVNLTTGLKYVEECHCSVALLAHMFLAEDVVLPSCGRGFKTA